MAQTPEGRVKDRIKKVIKRYGGYYYMPVSGGYGAQALDFHGCINGYAFFVEAKAGLKVMTPRQRGTAALLTAAGGAVFTVNDVTDEGFEEWIQQHSGLVTYSD